MKKKYIYYKPIKSREGNHLYATVYRRQVGKRTFEYPAGDEWFKNNSDCWPLKGRIEQISLKEARTLQYWIE